MQIVGLLRWPKKSVCHTIIKPRLLIKYVTQGFDWGSSYREASHILPTFTDDQARFGRRYTGCRFVGREEIVTDPLSELFSILTVGKGFEAGSLHHLYSLKGIFLICIHMCSLYRQKKNTHSESASFFFSIFNISALRVHDFYISVRFLYLLNKYRNWTTQKISWIQNKKQHDNKAGL